MTTTVMPLQKSKKEKKKEKKGTNRTNEGGHKSTHIHGLTLMNSQL